MCDSAAAISASSPAASSAPVAAAAAVARRRRPGRALTHPKPVYGLEPFADGRWPWQGPGRADAIAGSCVVHQWPDATGPLTVRLVNISVFGCKPLQTPQKRPHAAAAPHAGRGVLQNVIAHRSSAACTLTTPARPTALAGAAVDARRPSRPGQRPPCSPDSSPITIKTLGVHSSTRRPLSSPRRHRASSCRSR